MRYRPPSSPPRSVDPDELGKVTLVSVIDAERSETSRALLHQRRRPGSRTARTSGPRAGPVAGTKRIWQTGVARQAFSGSRAPARIAMRSDVETRSRTERATQAVCLVLTAFWDEHTLS